MSQRADLIKKIKSLLAKTVENGCTEGEAIIAAVHAAKLMEQYDLTFEDVEKEVRAQNFKPDARLFRTRWQAPAVSWCTSAIAEFFDCIDWTSGMDLVFFGTEDDTSLAHSMTTMLQGAIEYETNAYLARTPRNGEHGGTRRASFVYGMTGRISGRLRALKRARTKVDQEAHETLATIHAAGNFHAPVEVTKKMVVKEKFEDLGIKLSHVSRSRTAGSHSAYAA